FNWFLNYDRSFCKHNVQGLLVFEQAENGGYIAFAQGEDPLTTIDQFYAYPYYRQFRSANAWEETGARQSYIGRFNYNYADKYIAEFSFRYDGNTLFPTDKRWGFFPSVSAAWRLSEEPFFQEALPTFNEFKLRASYGTTGNDLDVANEKIADFAYQRKYIN